MNDNIRLDKKIESLVTHGKSFDPRLRNMAMLSPSDRECYFEDEPSNYNTPLGLQIALASRDVLDKKYDARRLAEAFDMIYVLQIDHGYGWNDMFNLIQTPEEFALALYDPSIFFSSKRFDEQISMNKVPSDSKFNLQFR